MILGSVLFKWKSALFFMDVVSKNKLLLFSAITLLVTVSHIDAKNCTTMLDFGGAYGEKLPDNVNVFRNASCRLNDHCSASHVCCSSRCIAARNCLQQSCSKDHDCQLNETCCYGFCKRYSDCVDVVMIVILCVVFITMLTFCSCACGKILSNPKKKQCSSFFLSSQMTLSNSFIRTGRAFNLEGFTDDVFRLYGSPPNNKGYLLSSKSNALLSYDKLNIDAKGKNKPGIAQYGSTCVPVPWHGQ